MSMEKWVKIYIFRQKWVLLCGPTCISASLIQEQNLLARQAVWARKIAGWEWCRNKDNLVMSFAAVCKLICVHSQGLWGHFEGVFNLLVLHSLVLVLIREGGGFPIFYFIFKKRSYFVGPSPVLLEHGALPQHRSLTMLPSPKSKHALSYFPLAPTFTSYIHTWKLNMAKQCGMKRRCYWEHLRAHIKNLRNKLRTCWE